jgi:beta-phosphoglucomutase-like phosphatase (HAD superfamily)
MKKKFIIFDCDGVLVNTEVISNGVIAEFLNANGYPIDEENVQNFLPEKASNWLTKLFWKK